MKMIHRQYIRASVRNSLMPFSGLCSDAESSYLWPQERRREGETFSRLPAVLPTFHPPFDGDGSPSLDLSLNSPFGRSVFLPCPLSSQYSKPRLDQGLAISKVKGGDPYGKGFNRGTRRNGPLRGSCAGQKHPASPENRSGSVPWQRGSDEIPD